MSGKGQGSTATDAIPKKAALSKHIEKVITARSTLTLLFIDLDGFKQINDTNGHTAGDRRLQKVVKVIATAVAGKGRLYRYGGDEFAVMLPNFKVDEGFATAERIRRAILGAKPGGRLSVSASIGVAESSRKLKRPQAIINAADQAMYASKNSGKNRVTKWPLSTPAQAGDSRTGADLRAKKIERLIELAEFAVHRLQNDPQTDSAKSLHERVDPWEEQVEEALVDARASQSDRSWFRVIGTYTPKNLPGRTREHWKVRNELAERIDRLREITRRLEEHESVPTGVQRR